MYPNNPNLLEKSVWNKAEEMKSQVEKANQHPDKSRSATEMRAIAGLLIALGWLFSLMF